MIVQLRVDDRLIHGQVALVMVGYICIEDIVMDPQTCGACLESFASQTLRIK